MTNLDHALSNVKCEGLLGETLDFLSVMGHPISNLAHLLAIFSTSLGSAPRVIWRDEVKANMNWLIIGPTACGKGESLKLVKKLFAFDHRCEDLLCPMRWPGQTSGKEIVGFIHDTLCQYEEEENRMLLIYEEFATILTGLRIATNKLNGNLINLSEGLPVSESFRKGTVYLSDIHFGMVGHCTPEAVTQYTNKRMITDGLGNRFIYAYVPAPIYSKERASYDKNDLISFQGKLKDSLEKGCETFGIELDKEAEEMYLLYHKAAFNYESENKVVEYLTKRLANACLKIAMSISLINQEDKISLASMASARAVVEYSKATIEYLFNGPSIGSPSNLIREFIEAQTSATKTEITQKFSHSLSRGEIDTALRDLTLANLVTSTRIYGKRGKPTTTYTALKENA